MNQAYEAAYRFAKSQGSNIVYAPDDPAEVKYLTDWYSKEQAKLQPTLTQMLSGSGDSGEFTPEHGITGNFFSDPNVANVQWIGNQQLITYRDGTQHLNEPYEESSPGGILADVAKYGSIATIAALGGYAAMAPAAGAAAGAEVGASGLTAAEAGSLGTEGFLGLGGAGGSGLVGGVPAYQAGLASAMFTPEELALAESGASFTSGVPGVTTTAATNAGAASLMSGFTPEELALAGNGASFTSGLEGMSPGLATTLGSTGLTTLKNFATQMALSTVLGGIQGAGGGGGSLPTGGTSLSYAPSAGGRAYTPPDALSKYLSSLARTSSSPMQPPAGRGYAENLESLFKSLQSPQQVALNQAFRV